MFRTARFSVSGMMTTSASSRRMLLATASRCARALAGSPFQSNVASPSLSRPSKRNSPLKVATRTPSVRQSTDEATSKTGGTPPEAGAPEGPLAALPPEQAETARARRRTRERTIGREGRRAATSDAPLRRQRGVGRSGRWRALADRHRGDARVEAEAPRVDAGGVPVSRIGVLPRAQSGAAPPAIERSL